MDKQETLELIARIQKVTEEALSLYEELEEGYMPKGVAEAWESGEDSLMDFEENLDWMVSNIRESDPDTDIAQQMADECDAELLTTDDMETWAQGATAGIYSEVDDRFSVVTYSDGEQWYHAVYDITNIDEWHLVKVAELVPMGCEPCESLSVDHTQLYALIRDVANTIN